MSDQHSAMSEPDIEAQADLDALEQWARSTTFGDKGLRQHVERMAEAIRSLRAALHHAREERDEARRCWDDMDDQYAALRANAEQLEEDLHHAREERDRWQQTAKDYAVNSDFWRQGQTETQTALATLRTALEQKIAAWHLDHDRRGEWMNTPRRLARSECADELSALLKEH